MTTEKLTLATAVRIYCFRSRGYFGWGLTPQQAMWSAHLAGCPKKDLKGGFAVVLPVGVTSYKIDGDGCLKWDGGSVDAGYLTRWDRNKKTKTWERVALMRAEDTFTPATFLDI